MTDTDVHTVQAEVDEIRARLVKLAHWLNQRSAYRSALNAQRLLRDADAMFADDIDTEESYP